MMLSKKALKKRFGSRAAVTLALMVLAVVLVVASPAIAASRPTTVAEIALYQGPDREQILIEGAKKEGRLTFYNSHTWFSKIVSEFEKKYPFIKVLNWRSRGKRVVKRTVEEYAARRFLVDVVESSITNILIIHGEGIFQECYSPELRYYPDDVKVKGKTGVYCWADREIYFGLGFNTNLISPAEAPKTYNDLLDPRWKGKMSINASSTTIQWIGNALEAMGRDFLEKLSRQDIRVHNISSAALANLIIAEEVPLSPNIFDSNVSVAKKKGAPIDWRPLEPVSVIVGYSGITTQTTHPHAAMLFLDYIHSKEGQKVAMQGGLGSPRQDMGSLEKKFKKTYIEAKYPVLDEYEKKMNEWESLLKRLFIKKR